MTFIDCFLFAATRFSVKNSADRAPTSLQRKFAAFDMTKSKSQLAR
jgi:hypothetical protein